VKGSAIHSAAAYDTLKEVKVSGTLVAVPLRDGQSLVYSGVMEDPVYLAKPVEWSGTWGVSADDEALEPEV
jgi:hypothetical protein